MSSNMKIFAAMFLLAAISFTASLFIFFPAKKFYGIGFSPKQIFLSSNNSKPGDADGNGKLDGVDYSIILSNMGKNAKGGTTSGDFNEDGIVDTMDLNIYLNNYVL